MSWLTVSPWSWVGVVFIVIFWVIRDQILMNSIAPDDYSLKGPMWLWVGAKWFFLVAGIALFIFQLMLLI